MFAGIYYGGMYGGSTTSILLNTPGESASVMTAIEGNKMAKKGRAAQALATAAIGSFIAGTIGTLLVALLRADDRRAGGQDRGAVVLRDHVAVARARHRRARHLQAARLHRALHRPHDRADRLRPVHRPGAAHRRPDRADRRRQHRGGGGRPVRDRGVALDRRAPATQADRRDPGRPPVHGPRGLGALVEALVAWHRDRVPVRCPACRWRRDSDLPVLHHREEAVAPQGRVRQRRDRGRCRTGGGQQRERRRHVRAAADPRHPGDRHRLDPAGRDDRRTASSPGPDPDDRPARPDLDAARQPADRQRAACW